ncbi:MAG: hypothetical protein ACI822_002475, partial [Gammaproteobacteria bacterium]
SGIYHYFPITQIDWEITINVKIIVRVPLNQP